LNWCALYFRDYFCQELGLTDFAYWNKLGRTIVEVLGCASGFAFGLEEGAVPFGNLANKQVGFALTLGRLTTIGLPLIL
jgi:hypothetical protein